MLLPMAVANYSKLRLIGNIGNHVDGVKVVD